MILSKNEIQIKATYRIIELLKIKVVFCLLGTESVHSTHKKLKIELNSKSK